MTDFHGDRECVTHHACDCIQERLRKAEREADELREELAGVATDANNHAADADRAEAELRECREQVLKFAGELGRLKADRAWLIGGLGNLTGESAGELVERMNESLVAHGFRSALSSSTAPCDTEEE